MIAAHRAAASRDAKRVAHVKEHVHMLLCIRLAWAMGHGSYGDADVGSPCVFGP